MVHLTEAAAKSKPSIYRFINGLFNIMNSSGYDTIKFTLGDPTEPVNPHLSDAGIRHYFEGRGFEDGEFEGEKIKQAAALLGIEAETSKATPKNYTPFQGDLEIRNKLAGVFNERHETEYDGANFIMTAGANGAVDLAMEVLPGPFIIHEPGFGVYIGLLAKRGKEALAFDTTDDGFAIKGGDGQKLDRAIEEAYQKALSSGADVSREDFQFTFLLTDSGNPTGYKHSGDELREIADLFSNKWKSGNVVADSLYFELAHEEERTVTFLDICVGTELEDRIVFVDSISKADGASSSRGGYACCKDKRFASAAANSQLVGIVHPAAVSQKEVLAAIENRARYVGEYAGKYAEKVGFVAEKLQEIGVMKYKPNGGFYGIMDLEFMAEVPLSPATIEAAEAFYGEEKANDVIGDGKVGNDPFLASIELAKRTGVFSVPVLFPNAPHIEIFSEDRFTPVRPLVRIVPTIAKERLVEAADRISAFKAAVERGEDLPVDPPKRQTPKEQGSASVAQIESEKRAREGKREGGRGA